MNRLADLIPQPTPMTLGGHEWLVSQLTLRDIASLEAWVAACLPDPMAVIAGHEPGTPERRKALRAAFDLADRGLPGIDDPSAAALLSTPMGVGRCLWLSLRKAHPELTQADVIGIATEMTGPEWAAFDRLAWAADLWEIIQGEIYAEIGVKLPRAPQADTNWVRSFFWLARHAHLNVEEFADLTIGQWAALLSGGEKKKRTVDRPIGWTHERLQADVLTPLKTFWAEDETTGQGAKADG